MKLSTQTTGSGPRHIGLVHGLGASAETWQPLTALLLATGEFTVTTVDLRGHGRSDRAATYRLDELADDLVESLPRGLDSIVGHSLGGSVLVRAVDRLAPARAIYLDPGFHLALPTTGMRGRLFWLVPGLTLGVAGALQTWRSRSVRAAYGPVVKESMARARTQFDSSMVLTVFRDVAFHPVAAQSPSVPSTIVLSDDSPAVLPDDVVSSFEELGWRTRRARGLHHDMHLEDPDRIFDLIRDDL